MEIQFLPQNTNKSSAEFRGFKTRDFFFTLIAWKKTIALALLVTIIYEDEELNWILAVCDLIWKA